ncbi:MAG: hypothetical protein KatS3mg105_2070 [Gemmatales bacterium]|nr:MAG: hypothetical protein KatS3mg105_2070 [Gemmatales bacterium]
MLTFYDGSSPISRRQFLTIGALGLGGLSLSSLLSARAAAEESSGLLTGKSVIFLFQQGGPSQFETFDPKPNAPEAVRTVTGTVKTTLPGVLYGDTMEQLASLAHKTTIVRSFQTNNAGHNITPIVSEDTLEANIGCLYSRVAGATKANGMPNNMVLFPQAVDSKIAQGRARGNIAATGKFSTAYSPFIPGAGGQLQKNMTLRLPRDRFEDRRTLLRQLDKINRALDNTGQFDSFDEVQRQAYQLLLSGGVADALDLSKEDPAVVAQYDTSRFAQKHNWSKVARGKRGYYTGHAKSLGKLLLLARRLCEAGCGFITIHAGYDGVWDMHADSNNLNIKDGMEAVGRSFDHAVAAFIRDVEARGLQDRILLVCTGEMGRTPKINSRGGRDHWARLAPLLLYGGGTQAGKVIGQSRSDGGEPATDPFGPKHLISTILHTVFDVGVLRVTPGVGAVAKLAETEPITGVFA